MRQYTSPYTWTSGVPEETPAESSMVFEQD
jgi:hypothetical protein